MELQLSESLMKGVDISLVIASDLKTEVPYCESNASWRSFRNRAGSICRGVGLDRLKGFAPRIRRSSCCAPDQRPLWTLYY
jgi:hypothetical protein